MEEILNGIKSLFTGFFDDLWQKISGQFFDKALEWVYNAIFDTISEFLTYIENTSVDLFEYPWVKSFILLFRYFGMALFLVGLVVAIFNIAIEYQNMRCVSIKNQILPLIYSFMAVSLFTIVPTKLFSFCISLQSSFMHSLAELFSKTTYETGTYITAAFSALQLIGKTPSLINVIMTIAVGYSVIKVFFESIKRGGILLIQIAVGSLYMFSLPKGYMDGFISWLKNVIALCLTAFLQTVLLYMGLLTFQSNIVLGLGVMLAADEVPTIASHFGLDTSIKGGIKGAMSTTSTAINLTKVIAAGI